MTRELSNLIFSVPLSVEYHRLAQQFCRQQSDRTKAKQIYLNTLAVSAVKFYLQCMGIETNWEASLSYSPLFQSLMDVADLEITFRGKLECRPVLAETNILTIPPEVWRDRIGYIAVRLDSKLVEATLLGFIKTVPESGELPLNQLQSLEDLLKHLHQIRQLQPTKMQVNLGQWFQHIFTDNWQSVEALLATEQNNFAFSLRSASRLGEASVKRAKLIDLGLQLANQSVALLVAIAPDVDPKVTILVQLHPTNTDYLPPDIKLILLSDGSTLQEVQSRSEDNYIQLKRFRVNPGECFNIQVAFGDVTVTESFTI
ncbi:MAG TPA: DUF1822 family protein [Leptolyngbyaceae cyanobacterium]